MELTSLLSGIGTDAGRISQSSGEDGGWLLGMNLTSEATLGLIQLRQQKATLTMNIDKCLATISRGIIKPFDTALCALAHDPTSKKVERLLNILENSHKTFLKYLESDIGSRRIRWDYEEGSFAFYFWPKLGETGWEATLELSLRAATASQAVAFTDRLRMEQITIRSARYIHTHLSAIDSLFTSFDQHQREGKTINELAYRILFDLHILSCHLYTEGEK